MQEYTELEKKAGLVRKLILTSTTTAGSGHPTSSLSATDIMTVLFDRYFRYDVKNPENNGNDRLIFSKGHASPLFYTLWAVANGVPVEELQTLRKFGSRLEGHPTAKFPFTEVSTGSLGQGLSVGAGAAYAMRAGVSQYAHSGITDLPKMFVLLGDSELAEGQVWEAANFASYYKLNNLIAIVDVNRLGQSQETMFGHFVDEYITRFSAFNFEVLAIDGHSIKDIDTALRFATNNKSDKPFVIIAKTIKGKGVSFLEDKEGWHGKTLSQAELEKALKELGDIDEKLRFTVKKPSSTVILERSPRKDAAIESQRTYQSLRSFQDDSIKNYKLGDMVATREVYGEVLAALGKEDKRIYSLDAETKNSTFAQTFQKENPHQFVECFIAEQNMVGVAMGLAIRGLIPFASTFAAFFTRAFDQVRMAGLSQIPIKCVGSHAGVSIGEDGSSQMGLEDFALFGSIFGSSVIHPCDAVSTAQLLPHIRDYKGISYLRTLRPKTPVLYGPDEKFEIGGSKILRSSENDGVTVVACGITVFEALKAYEVLQKKGVLIRVVDCYSIKPVDKDTLVSCITQTKVPGIISVEDHWAQGGLGDMVQDAIAKEGGWVEKMAVRVLPCSGKMEEVLDYCGISASHIVKKVLEYTSHT